MLSENFCWQNSDTIWTTPTKFDSVIITTGFFVRSSTYVSVFLQPPTGPLGSVCSPGLLDHFLPSISFTSRACNYCLWQFFTVFTLLLSSHDVRYVQRYVGSYDPLAPLSFTLKWNHDKTPLFISTLFIYYPHYLLLI